MEFYSPPAGDGGGGGGGLKTSGVGYYRIPTGPSTGTLITPGVSNSYSAYVEMRSASGAALYIVGFSTRYQFNTTQHIMSWAIGTGGAGAESLVSEGSFWNLGSSTVGAGDAQFFPYPIPVAASTRIAMKLAVSNSSGPGATPVVLHVIDQSNLVSI